MIAGVVSVAAQTHDSERRGHGALAGSENRADKQDLGFPPGRGPKQCAKGLRTSRIPSGRVSIAVPFVREGCGDLTLLLSLVYVLYKVQLRAYLNILISVTCSAREY